jgi:hypothetical protein
MERGAGSMGDVPWASVFDPSANARALSAIQAEGFRAASELVDRFVRSAGGGAGASGGAAGPAAQLSVEQRESVTGALDLEPLMRSWFAMVGQYLMGADHTVGSVVDGAALDLADASSSGALALAITLPGMATAEVWVHNRSGLDLGDITLRCSELMADSGNVIRSDEIRLDPEVVAMPARCSRGVIFEVKVSQDISPGLYRGNLLVQEHAELCLPVTMRVRASLS